MFLCFVCKINLYNSQFEYFLNSNETFLANHDIMFVWWQDEIYNNKINNNDSDNGNSNACKEVQSLVIPD